MKLYDRKEIGAILKKAAENSSTDSAESAMGLDIEELQQLASEAGIDPDQITKAIAEIDTESGLGHRTFWGGPFTYSSQVVVDGEITVAQWEEMLISIRGFFQSKGEVETRESVLEWSSPPFTTNSAQVTALRDNGKTKISVGWNGPLTAVPFFLPIPVVVIASLVFASEFLGLSAVPGISLVLLLSALTFLAARWMLGRHLDNGTAKLGQLLDTLESIADRGGVTSEPTPDTIGAEADPELIHDPLLQIPQVESSLGSDSETTKRGRSQT
ncbi:MAG: hypothetical protein HKN13_03360 [Rhodothermales bacterium]|nr:hypothetical protein [Rhodothermales bacterium]